MVLQRQEQVRTWPVDDVSEPALIASHVGIVVALGLQAEVANVSRKWIVLPECAVEFKFRQRLIFELCPAADRVQRKHGRRGIGGVTVEDDAAAQGGPESADCLSAIEEAA